MSNLKKIRAYIDLIKKLHRQGISNPSYVLDSLLHTYVSHKKTKTAHHFNSVGILFGHHPPTDYAKKILGKLKDENSDLITILTLANISLSNYLSKNKHKVTGEYASLWVAFLYYYHPMLPAFDKKTFFYRAIINAHLIRKNGVNAAAEQLFIDLTDDNYSHLVDNCKRLINHIKICKLGWISPAHYERLIATLTWLPFWSNSDIDASSDNMLVAITTLQTLIPQEMLVRFYIETLTNLINDIENINFRILYAIGRIPFCNLDDPDLLKKLLSIIDNYISDENKDENFEYRKCVILEIILKITNNKTIHDAVYQKISLLLDSDQDNSAEMLIQNIFLPPNYKKIYIYKILNNIKTNRRSRYEGIQALIHLIQSEEDKKEFFNLVLELLIKKQCLNAVTAIKTMGLSKGMQKKVLYTAIKLISGTTPYLGVEIIRSISFESDYQKILLTFLRNHIKTQKATCQLIDAMRYLPIENNDLHLMIPALLAAFGTENEIYAICLLAKIPLSIQYQQKVVDGLTAKLHESDHLTISYAISSLIIISKRYPSLLITNTELFYSKLIYVIENVIHDDCIEKICTALPSLSIPNAWRNEVYSALIKLGQNRQSFLRTHAFYALARITPPSNFKFNVIDIFLKNLQQAIVNNYEEKIINDNIELITHYLGEYFSPEEQISVISLVEDRLVGHEIMADYLIEKIKTVIKVEMQCKTDHGLPTEVIKHVFHFA